MKKIFIISAFLLLVSQSYAQKNFNVRDFGAKGNGTTDDTQAFLNCLKEAVKVNSSIVLIPYGEYKISEPIDVYYTDKSLTLKGISKNGKKPTITTGDKNINIISLRGYAFKDASQGSATVENIRLVGGNPPYTNKHPFIHKSKFFYGIYIADKNKAFVNNVEIESIYGEGIGIISTDQQMAGKGRFEFVSVNNSKIINCWGYNPETDDYGDGIYIANTQKGEVKNNIIHNNLLVTKQLGRGGIVLEWLADHILIQNNDVKGYDRGIHLEGTCGGQQIINNNFSGSDLGIVLYEYKRSECSPEPVLIKENVINNTGFKKSLQVNRVRKPRSMINFLAKDNSRAGSIIESNTFTIDGNYQFEGNSFANIISDNLIFKNNRFVVINPKGLKQPVFINDNGQNTKLINNSLQGVKIKH